MIKPSITVKSVAQTIITSANVTSEVIEDAGGVITNVTGGLRGFTGVFKSWGTLAEKKACIDEEFEVKTMLRDYTKKFNEADLTLSEDLTKLLTA